MDDLKVEQRDVIHFLLRNGKSSSEYYQKLKNTYGKDCFLSIHINDGEVICIPSLQRGDSTIGSAEQ